MFLHRKRGFTYRNLCWERWKVNLPFIRPGFARSPQIANISQFQEHPHSFDCFNRISWKTTQDKIVEKNYYKKLFFNNYIHVGTPCNPFPLSMNQNNVQSVIQKSEKFLLFLDIFIFIGFSYTHIDIKFFFMLFASKT